MALIRRKAKVPQPLEFGTSFAAAATPPRRRFFGLGGGGAYDARMPDSHHSGDSSFIDPDQKPSMGGRVAKRLGSLLLLLVAIGLVGGIAGGAFLFSGGASSAKPGQKVRIVIPTNSDANAIATVLADAGIVDNKTIFRAKLKLNGDGSEFRSGTYTMKTGSSYDTVVRVLEKGPAALPTFNVNLPEGMRIEETAAHLEGLRTEAGAAGDKLLPAFSGAEWLTVVRAQRVPAKYQPPKGTRTMEGFLFPATYELRDTAKAQALVQKQVDAFAANFDQIDMTRATKANLTPYDVVIIASLIEREARLDAERRTIGAVIWNRLQDGEPLGIDASNQYESYKRGSKEFWKLELLQSDLDRESPYNLRKVAGLPPTPIANPGLKSLQAAANPADVDFKYYVADPSGNGKHFFTSSYDEFLNHPFQQG